MEYFIFANSFADPFLSNQSTKFVEAETPQEALEKFVKYYDHPSGLYSAAVYPSATAYHKKETPIAKWLCNHAIALNEATKDLGAYTLYSERPGLFKVDDKWFDVENPKQGRIV